MKAYTSRFRDLTSAELRKVVVGGRWKSFVDSVEYMHEQLLERFQFNLSVYKRKENS